MVIELGRALARDGYAATCMRVVRKDGESVWLEGHSRSGPNGEMMGMLRDVTDERRLADKNAAIADQQRAGSIPALRNGRRGSLALRPA